MEMGREGVLRGRHKLITGRARWKINALTSKSCLRAPFRNISSETSLFPPTPGSITKQICKFSVPFSVLFLFIFRFGKNNNPMTVSMGRCMTGRHNIRYNFHVWSGKYNSFADNGISVAHEHTGGKTGGRAEREKQFYDTYAKTLFGRLFLESLQRERKKIK